MKGSALGTFAHRREPTAIDRQDVIRMNRDTLYSSAVIDLDASPATVTLPDAAGRFMAMQVINEDHYTVTVVYEPGVHTFTKEQVATRYVLFLVRTFVDPANPSDVAKAHAAQDALTVTQSQAGRFEVPDWDSTSLDGIRQALNALAAANGGWRADGAGGDARRHGEARAVAADAADRGWRSRRRNARGGRGDGSALDADGRRNRQPRARVRSAGLRRQPRIIVATCLVAAFFPARRAARIDPIQALRAE